MADGGNVTIGSSGACVAAGGELKVGSSVANLQSLRWDNVLLTERVLETTRACTSFDVRDFAPLASGLGNLPSIQDNVDLTGAAIVHMLHFGLYAEVSPEDSTVMERLKPIAMATLYARTSLPPAAP